MLTNELNYPNCPFQTNLHNMSIVLKCVIFDSSIITDEFKTNVWIIDFKEKFFHTNLQLSLFYIILQFPPNKFFSQKLYLDCLFLWHLPFWCWWATATCRFGKVLAIWTVGFYVPSKAYSRNLDNGNKLGKKTHWSIPCMALSVYLYAILNDPSH